MSPEHTASASGFFASAIIQQQEAAYDARLIPVGASAEKPTAREKALCLQAQDKGLSTVEDLIYALINTRQFIFNQ